MASEKTVLGAPPRASGSEAPLEASGPTQAPEAEQGSRILELDLSEVSTDFEAMPVGLYGAVVGEALHVPISKKSGKPYVKITFDVTAEGYSGRKQFGNYSLSPAALWKLAKLLDSLGFDVDEDHFKLDLDAMIGLPCVLSLSVETYNNKIKNVIMDVLPATTITTAAAPF